MLSSRCISLTLLAVSSSFVFAAPKRRGCHFSDYTYSEGNIQTSKSASFTQAGTKTIVFSTSETQISMAATTSTLIPVSQGDDDPDVDGGNGSDSSTAIPTQANPNLNPEHFTTLTTVLSYASVPPELVLVYPNTTIIESFSLNTTTTLQAINTTSIRPSSRTQFTTPPSRTSTRSHHTTPDMGAMQTAFYEDICSWVVHRDDAICLGANVMMCCRADNPACNKSVLEDGGLYCDGVRSGDWARTWTRPTVTATATATGAAGVSDTSSAKAVLTVVAVAYDER